MCNQRKNNRKQLLSVLCFCKHPVTIFYQQLYIRFLFGVFATECKEAAGVRGFQAGKQGVLSSEQFQRDLKGAKNLQDYGALFSDC